MKIDKYMPLKNSFLLIILLAAIPFTGCIGSRNKDSKDDQKKEKRVLSPNINLADPYILLHDGVYYAYGTSSDEGFEVHYSDNLHDWIKHPEMLLKKEDSYGEKWFWAPEVYYNPANKKFYLYYSAEEHICVATSDSPLGPFKQDVKKPMREEKGIDSSLFLDDDGTPYIFFDRFTNGNVIWVAQLENDWTTIKEETLTMCIEATQPWETVEGKVVEGASVLKHDGVYYMIYSGNDFRSLDYGVGFATATSPFGPWTKSEGNPVLQRPTDSLVGTGHGAYFGDKDGGLKYVFHAHADTTKVHPRLMYITDMSITGKQVVLGKDSIISPNIIEEY